MNVDIVNISTFGIWSQFGTIKYWFIHIGKVSKMKKKLVEYSTKGLTPLPLVEKFFIS